MAAQINSPWVAVRVAAQIKKGPEAEAAADQTSRNNDGPETLSIENTLPKEAIDYALFYPVFGITFDCLHDSPTRRGSARTANRVYVEREQRQ